MARSGSDCLKPALLAFAFVVLTQAVIWTGRSDNKFEYGQRTSHLPVIRAMTRQWPALDLVNYPTETLEGEDLAMTPGYHILMAAFARYVSDNLLLLRLLNSLFGFSVVLIFYFFTKQWTSANT